jgi:hypothetical protein
MNKTHVQRLEKLLERALTEGEIARLRRIKTALEIDDDDALWDVLAAMEYQRKYYEELPAKIAAASEEILHGMTGTAERESARAQDRLAESVVEQAKKLAGKISYAELLPVGLLALICLLLYGSLLLWAGFCIGSGRTQPPELLLRMPSGLLIGGLCLMGGVFLGVKAAKDFAEGEKGWRKPMLAALALLLPGGAIVSLTM